MYTLAIWAYYSYFKQSFELDKRKVVSMTVQWQPFFMAPCFDVVLPDKSLRNAVGSGSATAALSMAKWAAEVLKS